MADAITNETLTDDWLDLLERRSRARNAISCADAIQLIRQLRDLRRERRALLQRNAVIEKSLLIEHPSLSEIERKRVWAELGWIV